MDPRICQEHFNEEDIIKTKRGLKIRKGANPRVGNKCEDDGIIVSEDGVPFSTNKALLAACSPFFRRLFSESGPNQSEFTIHIQTSFVTTQAILDIFYGAETTFSEKHRKEIEDTLMLLEFDSSQLMMERCQPEEKQEVFNSNKNGLGVLGVPSYAMGSYGGGPSQIGARPTPSIQMYSSDDTADDHRGGPIYDTINDDNSSHSQSSYGNSAGSGSDPGPSVVDQSLYNYSDSESGEASRAPDFEEELRRSLTAGLAENVTSSVTNMVSTRVGAIMGAVTGDTGHQRRASDLEDFEIIDEDLLDEDSI